MSEHKSCINIEEGENNPRDVSSISTPIVSKIPNLQLFPSKSTVLAKSSLVSVVDKDLSKTTDSQLAKTRKITPELGILRARSLSIGSTISASHDHSRKSSIAEKGEGTKDAIVTEEYEFFKRQGDVQISIKDIKQQGLKALLRSSVPLGYFLYYLMTEYCSENLFFYLAVDNYQRYEFSNQAERRRMASKIAKTYLESTSEVEANLEDRIHKTVKKALEQQQKVPTASSGNEFDAAKRHVFTLLNSSYHRFRISPIWSIMESKCSELDSYSVERSQTLVVSLLLSYIKRNQGGYYEAILKLVHSFCVVYLPIGYRLYNKSYQCLEHTSLLLK
ncbi:hypothetical protein G6F70_007606 [Rhizopus microsporus]|nr:hypothetical protein G6F71_007327 [Rhizopus microsporus]KAG1196238.1 hypothetical protein G6F70_007606 [Rhizopus microsporus]KAG1207766.1 hypothetical protein G6F69_007772 [Rhizopus microsporus]KAG1229742.1 hypothetical protein G6F67_006935 [Rhizopus microsporus]KAG1260643.1 hypothetical protein G6F68_007288 [Rhizopus microsporus]